MIVQPRYVLCTFALTAFITACDGGGSTGSEPAPPIEDSGGQTGPVVLTVSTDLSFGSKYCPNGGRRIAQGPDSNGDGVLSFDEIETRELECEDTPEGDHGPGEHRVKFLGDAIVHSQIVHRETGHVLVEAFPFGHHIVNSHDHSQTFSQDQYRAHLLALAIKNGVSVGGDHWLAKSITALRDKTTLTTLDQVDDGDSDSQPLYTISSCGADDSVPDDQFCGLAVGYDEQLGSLTGSSGCYWFTLDAINDKSLSVFTGSVLAEGETFSSSTDIEGSASMSYGAFSGSASFSYKDDYSSSSYGSQSTFMNYFLVQPTVTVSAVDASSGAKTYLNDWTDQEPRDVACGTQFVSRPIIGMSISGSLGYQLESQSAEQEYESKAKASYSNGLSSASAKISTSISEQSTSSSASFSYLTTILGGGAKYAGLYTSEYATEALSSYSDCFTASGDSDPDAVATACGTFFEGVQQAAAVSLGALQDNWGSGQLDSRDLSFMAIFPSGIDDPNPNTVSQFTAAQIQDVPVANASSQRAIGLDADLKAQFSLLNEVATLSNRVDWYETQVTEVGGIPGEASVDVQTALEVLESDYDSVLEKLNAAVESCLVGKDGDPAEVDCSGIDNLKSYGPSGFSAFSFFDNALSSEDGGKPASDTALYALYDWYFSKYLGDEFGLNNGLPSTTAVIRMRENSVILPLVGQAVSETLTTERGITKRADGFEVAQELPVGALWMTLTSADAIPQGVRSKNAVVVFPVQNYPNVLGATTTQGDAFGLRSFLFVTEAEGVNKLPEALAGPRGAMTVYVLKDFSFDTKYLTDNGGGKVGSLSNLTPSCDDFSDVNGEVCSIEISYEWSPESAETYAVTPKYVVVDEYRKDDGCCERETLPPDWSSDSEYGEGSETQWVISGLGAKVKSNNFTELQGRYTNINEVGFGALLPDYSNTADASHICDSGEYRIPCDGLELAGNHRTFHDPGRWSTGYTLTSNNDGIRRIRLYYSEPIFDDRWVDIPQYQLGVDTSDEGNYDEYQHSNSTKLEKDIKPEGNKVLVSVGATAKNNDVKFVSHRRGKVTLDDSLMPTMQITLTRKPDFYQ